VTLDELHAALTESLAHGTVGVPVALRIHLQYSDPRTDLFRGWGSALGLAEAAFPNARLTKLFAQRESNGGQLNVLATCSGGQTLLVTLGRGSAARPLLELVLVANRGIVRLEGEEFFEPEDFEPDNVDPIGTQQHHWHAAIERSLREHAAVDVDV
jgi:hypothetical protein